jgi:hypothetical protein
VTLERFLGGDPPSVRASDADRERYVEILEQNCAAGRITADELSARVEKALEARTIGELKGLIADLPEGNVDPLSQFVGGAVETGLHAARIGLWLAGGMVLLTFVLPLAIGLAVTVSPLAGLATGVAVVVLAALAAHSLRRR